MCAERASCWGSSWWRTRRFAGPFAPQRKIGLAFDRIAYENGLVARCMGDMLGFSPPLVVDARDMDEIARRCEMSLRNLERLLEADPLDRPA
jgi:4-aminobutyrate--pyruvate transaminase